MVPVARRNLLAEKLRLAIAIGGVAFAVFLIVVILSLYYGMRSAAGEFAKEFPADLWVAQRGLADLTNSSSEVPLDVRDEVAALSGVQAAVSARGRFLLLKVGKREDRAFLIAFEDGPVTTLAFQKLGYQAPPGRGQVIAHRSIASTGERLTVAGREFAVVGTYAGGTPFGGYSFMNYQDATDLFGVPGYTNFIVLFLADSAQPDRIATSIRQAHPELDALTGEEISRYVGQQVDAFLPVITVILVIAFLVGAAIISLIIYTATIERARDYAVLKALGASNGRLLRIVLSQSFIVGLAGFAIGVPMATIVAANIERIVPEFLTRLDWQSLVPVLGATILMCAIAAYLPVRRIAQIDPAAVFRA